MADEVMCMRDVFKELNDLESFCYDISEIEAISSMRNSDDRKWLQKSYQAFLIRLNNIVDKVGEKLKRCSTPDEKSV